MAGGWGVGFRSSRQQHHAAGARVGEFQEWRKQPSEVRMMEFWDLQMERLRGFWRLFQKGTSLKELDLDMKVYHKALRSTALLVTALAGVPSSWHKGQRHWFTSWKESLQLQNHWLRQILKTSRKHKTSSKSLSSLALSAAAPKTVLVVAVGCWLYTLGALGSCKPSGLFFRNGCGWKPPLYRWLFTPRPS